MKIATAVAAGFAAGLAFVVACHHTTSAHAGPADCASWQIAEFNGTPGLTQCSPSVAGTDACLGVPSGWEPISATITNVSQTVIARRCAP